MSNLANSLISYEMMHKEQVTAIVVGSHYDDRYSREDRRPAHQRNVVLSREDGLALLNEDYDSGYGGADCFPFYAWSPNYFYTVSEYDGSTMVSCWPRNPIDCKPEFD